jgi:hypothetical protein
MLRLQKQFDRVGVPIFTGKLKNSSRIHTGIRKQHLERPHLLVGTPMFPSESDILKVKLGCWRLLVACNVLGTHQRLVIL